MDNTIRRRTEKKVLLIVAAGKATRFNGFPKAFAPVNGIMNIENTIKQAACIYDQIYAAVNEETYGLYKDKLQGCELFAIATGNGEAHSLLKSLKYIKKKEPGIRKITVCWGDAYFSNQMPFKEAEKYEQTAITDRTAVVFCAMDYEPYAWFEVKKGNITRSYFARENGQINEGIHDQSLFMFNIEKAIKYLSSYKEHLGIPDEYTNSREMRLLNSFAFLYESREYQPAECVMIQAGNVFSFNTVEDIKKIEAIVISRNRRGENIC